MASIVNERDDSFLEMEFTDKDGYPVTPVTGTYSIEDVQSGVKVRTETTFTPTSATHVIAISSAENDILNTENGSEERRVTLSIYYLDDDNITRRKNIEFFYLVNNLRMLTTPVLASVAGTHALTTDSITVTLP